MGTPAHHPPKHNICLSIQQVSPSYSWSFSAYVLHKNLFFVGLGYIAFFSFSRAHAKFLKTGGHMAQAHVCPRLRRCSHRLPRRSEFSHFVRSLFVVILRESLFIKESFQRFWKLLLSIMPRQGASVWVPSRALWRKRVILNVTPRKANKRAQASQKPTDPLRGENMFP